MRNLFLNFMNELGRKKKRVHYRAKINEKSPKKKRREIANKLNFSHIYENRVILGKVQLPRFFFHQENLTSKCIVAFYEKVIKLMRQNLEQ